MSCGCRCRGRHAAGAARVRPAGTARRGCRDRARLRPRRHGSLRQRRPAMVRSASADGRRGGRVSALVTSVEGARQYSGRAVTVAKTGRTHPLASTQIHHSLAARTPPSERRHRPGSAPGGLVARCLRRPPRRLPGGTKSRTICGPRTISTPGHRWGMSVDLERVHRVLGVRDRVSGGEQHPRGRSGRSATAARDALDSDRSLLLGQRRGARSRAPADALSALRSCAVRNGVSGDRHVAHRGGAQRAGLQPLRRDPVLRQQLSRTRYGGSTGSTTRTRIGSRISCSTRTSPSARAASWKSAPSACSESKRRKSRPGARVRLSPTASSRPRASRSCPAQAIVFGDLRDPKSRVAALAGSRRAYRVLEDLDTGRPCGT